MKTTTDSDNFIDFSLKRRYNYNTWVYLTGHIISDRKRAGQSVSEKKILVFPLSQSQQNIWNLERTFAGTSINNISTTIRIHGRIDFVLLQKSIQMVLEADISPPYAADDAGRCADAVSRSIQGTGF